MRELHVIGLDAGGKNVLLRERGTDEQYAVPADDRLRAAARGDLSRLGQIEVETSSSLRPREIQAKIRLGATVSEVAAEAGVPESRVERFAHPVLLERSNVADLARKGHPVRANGPAERSLGEIVESAFRGRGFDTESGEWDAWRNADGEWIVRLSWRAGHTDNAAHWRLYRDTHGGTLTALDESAAELIDPDEGRPLRPLTAVAEVERSRRAGIHGPVAEPAGAPHGDHDPDASEAPGAPAAAGEASDSDVGHEPSDDEAGSATGTDGPAARRADTAGDPLEDEPQDALIPHPDPQHGPAARKRKPAMPSWEDVLLGVRSNANG